MILSLDSTLYWLSAVISLPDTWKQSIASSLTVGFVAFQLVAQGAILERCPNGKQDSQCPWQLYIFT